jgi:hypothetical protein
VSSYEDLVAACRAQVQALGINYTILDSVAGFTEGYAAKLLGHSEYCSTGGRRTKRHFSPDSFDAYLAALGFDLVLVENADKVTRLKAFMESKLLRREGPIRSGATDLLINVRFSRDFVRKIGRKGGLARGRKLAARASLREAKRRAALVRWSKQKG